MEFVQYLLTHGVMVLCEMSSLSHYTCVSSHSALMVAARSGKTEVVSLLVKAGAICCHLLLPWRW